MTETSSEGLVSADPLTATAHTPLAPPGDPEQERKLAAFDIVAQQYRHDLNVYWVRANFFLFVQSGLLAFLTASPASTNERLSIKLTACAVGLAIAVVWYGVSQSSLYWIGVWRKRVCEIDEDINPYRSFSAESLDADRPPFFVRLRPTVITGYLPIVFIVAWLVLAAGAIHNQL